MRARLEELKEPLVVTPEELKKARLELRNLMAERAKVNVAEKDLAWALQLGRKTGVSLPVTGLVSQSMARIYGVEYSNRR